MIHLENWSLYLIIAGAFLGGLLIASATRRGHGYYDPPPDYYRGGRRRYYHDYPYGGYGYRRDSGWGFAVFLILVILALLWVFGGGEKAQQASVIPTLESSAAQQPETVQVYETCYLEFGAYPSWQLAHDARVRMMVKYEQNLEVLQCDEGQSPYCVVLGPFRNRQKAANYQERYGLRAHIVSY